MDKKARLSEFNRQNIINTAKKLFYEKGIMTTTMDDIAKAADCSKSTIYVYFKNKEELYNYIVLEHFEILRDGIYNAVNTTEGLVDGFFAICNALASFYENYALYFDIVLGEVSPPTDDENDVLTKIYVAGEQTNQIIGLFVQRAVARQEMRMDINPLHASFVIWVSICNTVRFANIKEWYIKLALGMDKAEFMQGGFELLLSSVLAKQ